MDTQKQTRMKLLTKRTRARRSARGLTLIELMIVITLIGALLSVIAIGIFSKLAKGEKDTAKMGTTKIVEEATLYSRNHSDVECPTVDMLKTEGLKDKEVKDPWGQPYIIKCDGPNIVVVSKGPDKKENTPDDIRSDQDDKK